MRGRRPLRGLLLALVGALALTGCGDSEGTAPSSGAGVPSSPGTWPLTGVRDEGVASRPALAIKVENTAMARPQTGLEDADIVWEELVEGGLTRFNAVYHSTLPATVGPIRSLRPMGAGIAAPLGAPQVISGGQPLFLDSVQRQGVQLISNEDDAAGFVRGADRQAPHNLYGTPEDFLPQAEGQEGPPEQFGFAPTEDEATAVRDGEPAGALRLAFPASSPGWTWDDSDGRWRREESGTPALSAVGEQLSTVNIVVIRVEVADSEGHDQSGDPVPETVLTGDGDALVATGGRTVAARWSKTATAEPVVLSTADDAPVRLAPGPTWVELVPLEGGSVDVDR